MKYTADLCFSEFVSINFSSLFVVVFVSQGVLELMDFYGFQGYVKETLDQLIANQAFMQEQLTGIAEEVKQLRETRPSIPCSSQGSFNGNFSPGDEARMKEIPEMKTKTFCKVNREDWIVPRAAYYNLWNSPCPRAMARKILKLRHKITTIQKWVLRNVKEDSAITVIPQKTRDIIIGKCIITNIIQISS